MEDIAAYWGQFMRAEDLSKRTIEDRLGLVARLQQHVEDVLTCTRRDLIDWMAVQEWGSNTRVHRRSELHTFFTWLQSEGLRLDNPAISLPSSRYVKRDPTPFAISEIDRLMNSGIYKRTRMMVALHYYIGLRVSEIARVNGDDISWEQRTLTTIGKGNKKITLPIPARLWELCLQMPRRGYWFPNHQDNRLFKAGQGHILGRSVSDTMGDAIRREGLRHRPHDLRASTATQMHKGGASAFTIQKAMRHENMETTNRYLVVDIDQVRDGFDRLPEVDVPSKSGRKRAA